jgi:uncharacterized protein (DUF433 family)
VNGATPAARRSQPGAPRAPAGAAAANRAAARDVLDDPAKIQEMDLLKRITHDPAVMGGRPCIRGMRVTVGTIVGLLAAGHTVDDVLDAYPYLEKDDVQAALAYAAWRAEEVELPLT